MMNKAERERVEQLEQLETRLREASLKMSNAKLAFQQEIEKLKKEVEQQQTSSTASTSAARSRR